MRRPAGMDSMPARRPGTSRRVRANDLTPRGGACRVRCKPRGGRVALPICARRDDEDAPEREQHTTVGAHRIGERDPRGIVGDECAPCVRRRALRRNGVSARALRPRDNRVVAVVGRGSTWRYSVVHASTVAAAAQSSRNTAPRARPARPQRARRVERASARSRRVSRSATCDGAAKFDRHLHGERAAGATAAEEPRKQRRVIVEPMQCRIAVDDVDRRGAAPPPMSQARLRGNRRRASPAQRPRAPARASRSNCRRR